MALTLVGLLIGGAAIAADRTDAEVAAMLRQGGSSISGKDARHQADLTRATKMILRHRRDCLEFSDSYLSPTRTQAAGEPVYRVACRVERAPGGHANFFVRRSQIGKGAHHIWRDPP